MEMLFDVKSSFDNKKGNKGSKFPSILITCFKIYDLFVFINYEAISLLFHPNIVLYVLNNKRLYNVSKYQVSQSAFPYQLHALRSVWNPS